MKLIRSTLDLESRVLVMGALNVTPDSFSDGGKYADLESAVARAFEIEAEGADILDIGGESTRPGSKPAPVEEEMDRVMPVIEALRGRLRIPLSVDTTKSEVARAALRAGAEIINDVSGLRFDPAVAEVVAETGAALVLMHSRGAPGMMHQAPPVDDVFAEVISGLRRSIEEALRRGAPRERIILDPGIGFGKTPEQNLQLIDNLDRVVTEFSLPVLLGTSRKSFIKRALDKSLSGAARDDLRERVAGTAATIVIGVLRGARILRVHDVGLMLAVTRMTEAVMTAGRP
ncbi:MAG TPA: dihydropteroate synthase [Blastocatellia bacterium]|jgi:dihydropteroate synthase|nr:dihydropteroate synthase [Blastocatellia bacterium]